MERAIKLLGQSEFARKCLSDEELARAAWARAVGPKIAGHSAVAGLIRGRLVVDVDDAVWRSQLTTMRKQVVAQVNKVVGRDIVVEIEFRVAAQRRQPGREFAPVRGINAEGIADPILGRLYRASQKKETA